MNTMTKRRSCRGGGWGDDDPRVVQGNSDEDPGDPDDSEGYPSQGFRTRLSSRNPALVPGRDLSLIPRDHS